MVRIKDQIRLAKTMGYVANKRTTKIQIILYSVEELEIETTEQSYNF